MERAMLEYLANALWQLPVLAAGAWTLLWLMKPGPRTQYRVWLAVLGLAVVLPACGIRGGEIVPVPGAAFDELATARIVQRSAGVVVVDATAPVASVPVRDAAKEMWRLPFRVQRVNLSAKATHWVIGVYAGSVLLGLMRVVRAWRSARGLVESSREVVLCSTATAVLNDFGRSFEVKLPAVRECAEVASPMVVGALSPVVLLPEGFSAHAEDEVKAALLHELAHVKRRDYLMNGICQLVAVPVGWHPATHEVQQRIRRTREMACDEMAAREMRSEIGYARCLLTMARGMLDGGLAERPEFVGLFSNNVLEERVMRLMQTKTVLSARTKLARFAGGATAMAAATVMAASFHVVPTMAATVKAASAETVKPVPATIVPKVKRPCPALLAPRQQNDGMQIVRAMGLPAPVVDSEVVVRPGAETRLLAKGPTLVARLEIPTSAPFGSAFVVSDTAPTGWPAPQSAPAATPVAPVPSVVPVPPQAAPPAPSATPTPSAAPAPQALTSEISPEAKRKHKYVYEIGPGEDGYVIVDGGTRAMTLEEQEKIRKAMADSAEAMKKAMESVNSPEFRNQMAAAQEAMSKIKVKNFFDSEEFKRQMDAAAQSMKDQSAWNSVDFQEKMDKFQKTMKGMDLQFCTCKTGTGKEKVKQKVTPEAPQAK
jgi:beta-lactamase regulating signal transducer with metallopeptidase domain